MTWDDTDQILPQNRVLARHLAERVPCDGKPRQFSDRLIMAIARRLRFAVDTLDQHFER